MNILLLISRKEVREIVTFTLESKFQATVIEAATDAEAIEKLKDPDVAASISLVIVDYPTVGNLFFQFLSTIFLAKYDRKVPCLICSSGEIREDPILDIQNVVGFFYQKNILASLVSVLGDYIAESESGQTMQDVDFCRIKTDLLLRVSPLKADVFIRLSEAKYLKLFHEGDQFDAEDWEKYRVRKNVDYFYLRKQDLDEFLEKFKGDLKSLINTKGLTDEAAREMSGIVHETVQELIHRIGPTKDVQEVVKANIQLTVKSMGRNPKLKTVLNQLQKDPRKYISSHSVLLAHLACTAAAAMEWNSDTTFNKLSLAAFLHDITLNNHDLAAVRSLADLEAKQNKFKPEEIASYRFHPVAASEMAKDFDEVPPDVDSIIAQHHEMPDGTGFPRGLVHTRIGPLGSLFIVVHDLVSYTFEQQDKFKMEAWFEIVKDRYAIGNFKKVLKCLIDTHKADMSKS